MGPRLSVRSPWPYVAAALVVLVLVTSHSHSQSQSTSTSTFNFANNDKTDAATASSLRSSSTWSSYPVDRGDSLAYRNHLELTTSPASQITHSTTLGFSAIYVLSLPHRTDRRADMSKLARALGVNMTFIDAASKDEPFFQWIAERVAETRAKRVALMAAARKVRPDRLGGLAVGSVWVTPFLDAARRSPFPPLPDARYPEGNWTAHLEAAHSQGTLATLVPSSPDLNITDILWDKREWLPTRQVNDGVMSTFWGHTRVLKHMIEAGDESALVLEDDVDLEWDIERLWARMARKLPADWETVHLGHCWGHELLQPQYLHPLLHKATAPKCLHGWAVSARGAEHLLSLLNSPWSAYSTAVDVAVPSFIRDRLLRAFSVEPPLIIQRKDGPSDLQGGNGSKWRGLLRDSTFERIWKDEGHVVVEDVWDPKHLDPATTFREGKAENC